MHSAAAVRASEAKATPNVSSNLVMLTRDRKGCADTAMRAASEDERYLGNARAWLHAHVTCVSASSYPLVQRKD